MMKGRDLGYSLMQYDAHSADMLISERRCSRYVPNKQLTCVPLYGESYLVVLGVVNLHNFAADGWLKLPVLVAEVGQFSGGSRRSRR